MVKEPITSDNEYILGELLDISAVSIAVRFFDSFVRHGQKLDSADTIADTVKAAALELEALRIFYKLGAKLQRMINDNEWVEAEIDILTDIGKISHLAEGNPHIQVRLLAILREWFSYEPETIDLVIARAKNKQEQLTRDELEKLDRYSGGGEADSDTDLGNPRLRHADDLRVWLRAADRYLFENPLELSDDDTIQGLQRGFKEVAAFVEENAAVLPKVLRAHAFQSYARLYESLKQGVLAQQLLQRAHSEYFGNDEGSDEA